MPAVRRFTASGFRTAAWSPAHLVLRSLPPRCSCRTGCGSTQRTTDPRRRSPPRCPTDRPAAAVHTPRLYPQPTRWPHPSPSCWVCVGQSGRFGVCSAIPHQPSAQKSTRQERPACSPRARQSSDARPTPLL